MEQLIIKKMLEEQLEEAGADWFCSGPDGLHCAILEMLELERRMSHGK